MAPKSVATSFPNFPESIFNLSDSFLIGITPFEPRGAVLNGPSVGDNADDGMFLGSGSISLDQQGRSSTEGAKAQASFENLALDQVSQKKEEFQHLGQNDGRGAFDGPEANNPGSIESTELAAEDNQDQGKELDKWSCLGCGKVSFETLEEQRGHFKSDWHRLNVSVMYRDLWATKWHSGVLGFRVWKVLLLEEECVTNACNIMLMHGGALLCPFNYYLRCSFLSYHLFLCTSMYPEILLTKVLRW
jgi:hypothetical protein